MIARSGYGRIHAHHHADERDARWLQAESLACNAAVYVHLLLAALAVVPAWTLAVSVPVLVPRWMIAVHELFHLRTEREVDPVTRRLPLLFTCLSLGYRELLANHRGHHLRMATPDDPEYYQLRGGPLAGLFNAFTSPEQLWWRWVAERGMDRGLVVDTILRLALFLALIVVSGWTFLWYWVPARLSFGASYFVFFYALHRRGDAYGVYPLVLPPVVAGVARAVYGRIVVEATMHHDVHHAQPRIAARHLASCRNAAVASVRDEQGEAAPGSGA